MTAREYALSCGHEVVGRLKRMPEHEYDTDEFGNRHHSPYRFYVDEAGNEYWVSKRGCCIVTFDGNVI